jgi:hypothetical protein
VYASLKLDNKRAQFCCNKYFFVLNAIARALIREEKYLEKTASQS